MMMDDEDENIADDWAAALEDSEDGDGGSSDGLADEWAASEDGDGVDADALADEWATMAEGGDEVFFDKQVLNQSEIDSLLGFKEGDEAESAAGGVLAVIHHLHLAEGAGGEGVERGAGSEARAGGACREGRGRSSSAPR